MSRPDEGLIHQWLDGECTPEEAAELERLVATDPVWAAAVAEARGLMAASSRIVAALDAVPRAMPQGSQAAPAPRDAATRDVPRGSTRLRGGRPAWIGLAAAAVLVAGTAYVLREQATAPFGPPASRAEPTASPKSLPAATLARETTAASDSVAAAATELRNIQPPQTLPPQGPVRTADRVLGEAERSAGARLPVPSVQEPSLPTVTPNLSIAPPVVAPPAAPPAATPTRAPEPAPIAALTPSPQQRRAEADAVSRRGGAERILESPNSISLLTATRILAGCWRVTAPAELVGVLRTLEARADATGDSLIVLTSRGAYTVQQRGDTLRGGLTATRVPCDDAP